jgi:hypothetical protein
MNKRKCHSCGKPMDEVSKWRWKCPICKSEFNVTLSIRQGNNVTSLWPENDTKEG